VKPNKREERRYNHVESPTGRRLKNAGRYNPQRRVVKHLRIQHGNVKVETQMV